LRARAAGLKAGEARIIVRPDHGFPTVPRTS